MKNLKVAILIGAAATISPLLSVAAASEKTPVAEEVLKFGNPEAVTAEEKAVLRRHYQWKKKEALPASYTLEELTSVIDACNDNTLELEDYDWQVRKVVVALMVVGDKAFAKELDGRAVPEQKAAVEMLKPLWEKHRLKYPRVQEIATALKEAQ